MDGIDEDGAFQSGVGCLTTELFAVVLSAGYEFELGGGGPIERRVVGSNLLFATGHVPFERSGWIAAERHAA